MFWLNLLLAVVAFCAITTLRGRQKQTLPLPPGPRRKFIIGNLCDLPSPGQQDWHHWTKHKERYGKSSVIKIEMTRLGYLLIPNQDLSVHLLSSEDTLSFSMTLD
jgi:hypothetical protein